ncbi:MAG: hypothetical protein M0034_04415 [Deltaproteobacteria bacterium]|jgi:hypothetical protein|nr:hypothetical protein [Deltaproteobacteria bacterium]
MIAKETFIDILLKKLKIIPVGHYYDVRSYKRDRGFYIIKSKEDEYCILERGFFDEEFVSDFNGLGAIFKKLLKREFPRSHKLRIYNMGEINECIFKKPKRKTI